MDVIITVDARTAYTATPRGIGKTLLELYRRVAVLRPQWKFVMFHRQMELNDPFKDTANISNKRIECRGDRFDLWREIRLPLAAKRCRAHLLHCPGNTAPRWPLSPMVLTVHDLIPLQPEFVTPASRSWGRNVARAAQKARRIFTPSEFSKRQIVKYLNVSADKIIVNHWAANPNYSKIVDVDSIRSVRKKYGLEADRPYILGFGGIDPRKNTTRILQAWSALPAELCRNHQLFLMGIHQQTMTKFETELELLGITESCKLTGYVPDEDLAPLLRGATALCYPTLSEGFGLPVLDAFACETAVLAAQVTSVPEIAGDAALLVEPHKTEAITAALIRIMKDENLRDDLIRRGRERLKLFTWENCAARFCTTLEDIL